MLETITEKSDLLNHIQSAIFILQGSENEILFYNEFAGTLLKILNLEQANQFISELFETIYSGEAKKVLDSLVIEETLKTIYRKKQLKKERIFQVVCSRTNVEQIIITVRDISKEAQLIQEYTLAKKENQAKNLLQRRKEKEIIDLKIELTNIYEHVPDDLAIIDTRFKLRSKSHHIAKMMEHKDIEYCYEILGKTTICNNCPAKNGFQHVEKQQIGHNIDNKYITEFIEPISNKNGALIVFQDSTRKVTLIEQIREHREVIQQQKELLSNLVELLTLMQDEQDPKKVAHLFLEALSERLPLYGIMLLVQGNRRGSLWLKDVVGFPKEIEEKLTEDFVRLPIRKKEENFIPVESLPVHSDYEWSQVSLTGLEGQIGLLIIAGELSEEQRQIITLHSKPLGSFFANRILAQRLEIMANTDGLTGLYNRNYFDRVFSEEAFKFEKYNIPFTYVIGDANGLKPINDNYGHQAGDDLIIIVSQVLMEQARDTDTVARLGGDEFCILMPDTAQEGGESLILRIKEACKKYFVVIDEETKIPVNISLGASGSDHTIPSEIMKKADELMYFDKEKYYETRDRYR